MINIEIDGQKVKVDRKATIIEVADQLCIPIPRLCYHKKLSIIAACRLCLVEIVGSAKLVTACSTLVLDGMQIITNSPKVIKARQDVLELILINHPLNCPVCDKTGACDLQDIVMQYGKDHSCYKEEKRAIVSDDFNPLIKTEMTRCIHCMKCVRFCNEIAGTDDLAVINRGESTTIMATTGTGASAGVSGNIIDLCPVGALLPKPSLGLARNWELIKTSSIAPYDCFGSNIYIYTAQNKIVRIAARENDAINETWIADRDRFSNLAITSDNRLSQPLFKYNGKWISTTWQEALALINNKLQNIVNSYGPDTIGGLISSSATVEEQYLLQKYLRCMGSNNIDHRLMQLDFRAQEQAPLYPRLGVAIENIEKQKLLLAIGLDIQQEQPILRLKTRKMIANGGAIKHIVKQEDLVTPLLGIIKVLLKKNNYQVDSQINELLLNIVPTNSDKKLANELLMENGDKLILLGNFALSSSQASVIILLCNNIAKLTKANFGTLTNGANTAGAWLAGCVPHRMPGGQSITEIGKNAAEMLRTPLKSYILFGIEPELTSILGNKAISSIQQADFTVALSCHSSKPLLEIADVLLPITSFAEMAGTFVNIMGVWQSFNAAIKPLGESVPGWEVLQRLGVLANFADFKYISSVCIIDELQSIIGTKFKS